MLDCLKEAERIKDRLRACTTKRQVDRVADDERESFMKLRKSGGFGPVLAIQIQNLKSYMLRVEIPMNQKKGGGEEPSP